MNYSHKEGYCTGHNENGGGITFFCENGRPAIRGLLERAGVELSHNLRLGAPDYRVSPDSEWSGLTDQNDAALRAKVSPTNVAYWTLSGRIGQGRLIGNIKAWTEETRGIALENQIDWWKEYLTSLPDWDGTPRVNTLLVDMVGAEDNENARWSAQYMTIGAVEQTMRGSGAYIRAMPVLHGRGVGSSGDVGHELLCVLTPTSVASPKGRYSFVAGGQALVKDVHGSGGLGKLRNLMDYHWGYVYISLDVDALRRSNAKDWYMCYIRRETDINSKVYDLPASWTGSHCSGGFVYGVKTLHNRVLRTYPKMCIYVGRSRKDVWTQIPGICPKSDPGYYTFIPVRIKRVHNNDLHDRIAPVRDQIWAEAVTRWRHMTDTYKPGGPYVFFNYPGRRKG